MNQREHDKYANKEKSAITSKVFPRLIGILANLRKLSVNDAQDIAGLMEYDISKYLYEVPYDGIAKFHQELTVTLNP